MPPSPENSAGRAGRGHGIGRGVVEGHAGGRSRR